MERMPEAGRGGVGLLLYGCRLSGQEEEYVLEGMVLMVINQCTQIPLTYCYFREVGEEQRGRERERILSIPHTCVGLHLVTP